MPALEECLLRSLVTAVEGFTSSVIFAAAVPASATSTGVAGTFAYDANYLYVCVDTDTWKRVALSTWP